MYLAHFGFTHYPFERALQPDELFASSAAREASARLQHLVELRGIGLITGEVGCGKTTVCRQLCAALHPGLYRLFYVPLSTGNVLDMYKAIAWQLGLPVERNRAAAYRAIHTEVSRAWCWRPRSIRCWSWTRRSTCATMCSRTCACLPTTPWMPSGACACCWWGCPNYAGA
jgi:type II secretory pathway predicted ATPase ExeA